MKKEMGSRPRSELWNKHFLERFPVKWLPIHPGPPPLPDTHNYLIFPWHKIIECRVSITDVKRFRLPQVSEAHSEP